ncbi:MAG: hypothetical protein GSR80_000071 [Desulfurococcales archaeon]|nr:hypothetical protein [Desulfurococcales archaeon]
MVTLAHRYEAERIYRIPYSRGAVEAYTRGIPVIGYRPNDPAAKALEALSRDIAGLILEKLRGGMQ